MFCWRLSVLKWIELSVKTEPEFVEPLSEILCRFGNKDLVIEQAIDDYNPDEDNSLPETDFVTLKTYFVLDQKVNPIVNQIDVAVTLVAQLGKVSCLTKRILDHDEWIESWKSHFQVLRIGKNIVIVPTWRQYLPGDDDIVVHLDPGMAFGTGHHPTTRMCIEMLEQVIKYGDSILDVGCGSAILSIIACKLGAKNGVALDTDHSAVMVGQSNLQNNCVIDSMKIVRGSIPSQYVQDDCFDVAVMNISMKATLNLLEHLVNGVRTGGVLIVSGILVQDIKLIKVQFEKLGVSVLDTFTDSDWAGILALKS